MLWGFRLAWVEGDHMADEDRKVEEAKEEVVRAQENLAEAKSAEAEAEKDKAEDARRDLEAEK